MVSSSDLGVMCWWGPQVTVVARPQFREPFHLRVACEGEATDGELLVEYAGRLCYMSQSNPAKRTNAEYITNILEHGHGSVLEHSTYSLLIEGVSRSLSHELVRHRAGTAVSQLSQRYVERVELVIPPAIIEAGAEAERRWRNRAKVSVTAYEGQLEDLRAQGVTGKALREAARSLLPNAAETKLVFTANLRAWRHMIELRCASGADAEMRRLFHTILAVLRPEAPNIFADFSYDGVPVHRKV